MFCSNYAEEEEVVIVGKGVFRMTDAAKLTGSNAWRCAVEFVPTGKLPDNLPRVPPELAE
jgi:hypothetical protein